MMRSKKRRAEALITKLAEVLNIPIEVTSTERGRRLERHCAKKCRDLGLQVIDYSSKGRPYDLIVNGFRVQCKNRSKHGHNDNGVNLFKNSQKRYQSSEVDFFVIRFSRKCFVIPTSAISDDSGLVACWVRLTNKRHFIDAWHQLGGTAVCVDAQMSLFGRHG
jgi:hypothetical protein